MLVANGQFLPASLTETISILGFVATMILAAAKLDCA